jgi:hypothetical protein
MPVREQPFQTVGIDVLQSLNSASLAVTCEIPRRAKLRRIAVMPRRTRSIRFHDALPSTALISIRTPWTAPQDSVSRRNTGESADAIIRVPTRSCRHALGKSPIARGRRLSRKVRLTSTRPTKGRTRLLRRASCAVRRHTSSEGPGSGSSTTAGARTGIDCLRILNTRPEASHPFSTNSIPPFHRLRGHNIGLFLLLQDV